MEKLFGIIGVTHVDVVWKKSKEEMSEIYECVIVRLLDILDNNKDFTYVLEQAYLLRDLQLRRPDLIEKIKKYVKEGRLEIVGGMATTAEMNTISGESIIRNTLLGQKWFYEKLGSKAKIGWLIDTFGLNAQYPQLAKQFGYTYLFANRLGGNEISTAFNAIGNDLNSIPILGRDIHAPSVLDDCLHFKYVDNWRDYDELFHYADNHSENNLNLIMFYAENEVVPSNRSVKLLQENNKHNWKYVTPSEIESKVIEESKKWKSRYADLNPEFTGTFSNRIKIRFLYRKAEGLVQKLHYLAALNDWDLSYFFEPIEWNMAFVEAHDTITGSHPTSVYRKVIDILNNVIEDCNEKVEEILEASVTKSDNIFTITSFDQREIGIPITLNVDKKIKAIHCRDRELPFIQNDKGVTILPALQSFSTEEITLEYAKDEYCSKAEELIETPCISNKYISVSLINKKICIQKNDNVYTLTLVLQKDYGNFQIEEPAASELDFSICTDIAYTCKKYGFFQELSVSGTFPEKCTNGMPQSWKLNFILYENSDYIETVIDVDWKIEEARLRLRVEAPYHISSMYNEIPFGICSRSSYGLRGTCRGEWPQLRYSFVKSSDYGLGIVNTGTCGIELLSNALYMTIVRSPATEYAGMFPDSTSSQHELHQQSFYIVPFEGEWETSPILGIANATFTLPAVTQGKSKCNPERYLKVSNPLVSVSTLESINNGTLLRFVNLGEQYCIAELQYGTSTDFYSSDIEGNKLEKLESSGGIITLKFNKAEIKNILAFR